MKHYTFKLENNNNSINNLKKNIFNSYSNKYPWWYTLTDSKPYYYDTATILSNHIKNIYNNSKTYCLYPDYDNSYSHTDDYDYIINGTPVKIYDSYIQYGYKLIPIDNKYLYINGYYTKPTKETIIKIITTITIKY